MFRRHYFFVQVVVAGVIAAAVYLLRLFMPVDNLWLLNAPMIILLLVLGFSVMGGYLFAGTVFTVAAALASSVSMKPDAVVVFAMFLIWATSGMGIWHSRRSHRPDRAALRAMPLPDRCAVVAVFVLCFLLIHVASAAPYIPASTTVFDCAVAYVIFGGLASWGLDRNVQKFLAAQQSQPIDSVVG